MEFQQWVEENDLSEEDLQEVKRAVGKRALIYWVLCHTPLAPIMLPFLIVTWSCYKVLKQRTFDIRVGFFATIYSLAMLICFVMVIPAIIYFVLRKGLYGTGMRKYFIY